ncbi:MAG: hypothetical protein HC867_04805 [Bacteroidia bacterium]|nr:hypothetical protein [Bacteroidia bacterium]
MYHGAVKRVANTFNGAGIYFINSCMLTCFPNKRFFIFFINNSAVV